MCTRIFFKDANGKAYVARTMDFASDVGTEYGEYLPGNHLTIKTEIPFKAKFSSKFGLRFVSDGYNSKGLSIETLWLPETTFDVAAIPGLDQLGAVALPQQILGNCATVEDVKKLLDGKTVTIPLKEAAELATIHISLTAKNKTGEWENWVIEFKTVNGKNGVPVWYENPIGVMTNSPSFPWHLTNVRNYTQIATYNTESRKFLGTEFKHTSFGANQLGLPGGVDSPSRFIRATVSLGMALERKVPANENESVLLADHVLGLVSVVEGVSGDSGQKFDKTLWTVVKALDNYENGFWQKSCTDFGFAKLDIKPIKAEV